MAVKLSLLLSVFILAATIISIFLIERVGRKKLLVISMLGMGISSCAIGAGSEGVKGVIWFNSFVFSFGLGILCSSYKLQVSVQFLG
jgi:MFS family permease